MECKFQDSISRLVKMFLTLNFQGSLIEQQSYSRQNFKFLAVQESCFPKPKIGQNRPLTGF